MTSFYRFELDCECSGTLWLEQNKDHYVYGSSVDYSPKHYHLISRPEGRIRTAAEPDAATLTEHIHRSMTLMNGESRMRNLIRPACGGNRYHKRIWRPGQDSPEVTGDGYTDATTAIVSLQSDLVDLLRVIEPHPNNDRCYGHSTRELLILVSSEVELMWRSVLVANGYAFLNSTRPTTNDYVRVLSPLKLDQWSVNLNRYPSYPSIAPFLGWNAGSPTRSLAWYAAYNATKHDRAANFHEASFSAVLHSMAALFVLLVAQYGVSINRGYIGTAPDNDEQRVFNLEKRPTFALSEQYALKSRAGRSHVDFRF